MPSYRPTSGARLAKGAWWYRDDAGLPGRLEALLQVSLPTRA